MNKFFSSFSVLFLLLIADIQANAAEQYTVTYLGNFLPQAINNQGDVVGMIATSKNVTHAVLWQNGDLKDLGTLGGTYAYASDVNDNGQIVGYSETTDGSLHAFLYNDGKMNDLGTFGGVSSSAYGISNSGQIAANYESADGASHAILYDHGTINELGNLGVNFTIAKVINSHGEIGGQAKTLDGELHAFFYKQGNMTDMETGGVYSYVEGINDAGQIVGGWGTGDIPIRAFLYSNGNIINIDVFCDNTFANSINNNGEIVGYGPFYGNPFIYSNGHMNYLNEIINQTEITLTDAKGINDNGQIVASAYSDQYGTMAYLLTPIPEPSTLCLLSFGFIGFLTYKRHYKRRTSKTTQKHVQSVNDNFSILENKRRST